MAGSSASSAPIHDAGRRLARPERRPDMPVSSDHLPHAFTRLRGAGTACGNCSHDPNCLSAPQGICKLESNPALV